jgi:gamma-glutamyl-gamma-aminobutyrate hydrolase PuuD
LAETGQKQVESFMNHDGSLYGIMWHPERNNKITVEDIVLIKKIFGDSK